VDSRKTVTVFLKQPVPVMIVYWTVSVGATGELRYARDIYSLDAVVRRALDAPVQAGKP
jgi:murein L,D-transpeptidase YcbB/YkuD